MNEERKPNIENMLPFWSRDMRSIAVYDQWRSFSFRQSDRGALVWFSCRDPAYLLFAFILYFFLAENEWLFISLREKVQTILQKCLGVKWMWHILDFLSLQIWFYLFFYPFFFLLWLNDLSLIFVVTVKLVCQQINDWQSEAESCWLCAFSATRHISLIRGSFDEKP